MGNYIAGLYSDEDLERLLDEDVQESNEKSIIPETTKSYEGYVCFLDVLGSKEMIKNGETEKLIEELLKLSESVEALIKNSEWKRDQLTFYSISDCLIFACHDKKNLKAFLDLISNTMLFALSHEDIILLRGAIAEGRFYLPRNKDGHVLISGEAYIKAYQMEEKNTMFPRIILNDSMKNNTNQQCFED